MLTHAALRASIANAVAYLQQATHPHALMLMTILHRRFGIEEFAAVINPPEAAILAVGTIRNEPVVEDAAIVPGRRMRFTMSCDHRVIDGATGAKFMAAFKAIVEAPVRMLL